MSQGMPILLERDNVNDESVILTQWFVKNGEWVEEGTLIAEVETSKANVEVMAPQAGYLEQGFEEKAYLSYEAPLGYISHQPPVLERMSIANGAVKGAKVTSVTNTVSHSVSHSRTTSGPEAMERLAPSVKAQPAFPASTGYAQRFSRRAEELIRENDISKEMFSGLRMVRALNVLRLMGGEPPKVPARVVETLAPSSISKQSPAPPRLPTVAIPLSRMKRSEIQALGAGTRNAIPSAATVTCLTRGLRAALQRNPIVAGNAGAVIAYETARLLRKYPAFNATYRPDSMMQYEQVNIGYAIDDGRGLKVAVLRDCDTKSLAEITEELRRLVLAYLDNKLTPAQISGGTFTISDLSGMGVASFLPLISEDQGAILGVGGEQFLPGSRDGCYTLTLAFDHQLSEGRTAALFLNDLKDRLTHYEQAMSEITVDEPVCARCGRTSAELPDAKSFMVPSVVPRGYLCNLCVAGL
jgi:pyruvate/2-oxoglutarate dehydrogenase complex dihydrolipoamide acyltransferase (E2) component